MQRISQAWPGSQVDEPMGRGAYGSVVAQSSVGDGPSRDACATPTEPVKTASTVPGRTRSGARRKVYAAADEDFLASPMAGEARDISCVPDAAYASGAIGAGAVVYPSEGAVYAPTDGFVMTLPDATRHAIGISSMDGFEVLIHIGTGTAELRGGPFDALVEVDDYVEAGQLLVEADLDAIKAAGRSTATMVVITNPSDFASVKPLTGPVEAGDELIEVTRRIRL